MTEVVVVARLQHVALLHDKGELFITPIGSLQRLKEHDCVWIVEVEKLWFEFNKERRANVTQNICEPVLFREEGVPKLD